MIVFYVSRFTDGPVFQPNAWIHIFGIPSDRTFTSMVRAFYTWLARIGLVITNNSHVFDNYCVCAERFLRWNLQVINHLLSLPFLFWLRRRGFSWTFLQVLKFWQSYCDSFHFLANEETDFQSGHAVLYIAACTIIIVVHQCFLVSINAMFFSTSSSVKFDVKFNKWLWFHGFFNCNNVLHHPPSITWRLLNFFRTERWIIHSLVHISHHRLDYL